MADKNFPINDNNLAIAYYRFSSHSQNEASIDQQRDCAHEYAVSKGLTIVREYSDAAISGTTNARPQYQLMLSEIDKIKPAVLILWKTDRLGRNKIELIVAKKMIRESGCRIHLIAEPTPDDSPESGLMETILEGMTEFYSKNLSCNIRRGMEYNARHALFNGHVVFGYCVGSDKKYVIDPEQAPFVQRMFTEYADGKALTDIVCDMDAQGLRTSRGVKFSVNTVNKMLKNRAYIGEYHFGDIVIPDGMSALIDAATFDRVQERLRLNQRFGSQRKQVSMTDEAPRFWLTGKLFCGECGNSMQGISGTSKTKAKHYYYGCKGQRAKRCHKKAVRKAWIEKIVIRILTDLLNDTENLASLAIDAANYYNKNYRNTGYLESLEARRLEVEKGLANFVKAIEMGVFNKSTQKRMAELQEEKTALTEAIEAELVRQALYEDEHSIQAYFDKYLHADLNDPDVRESVLNYFVDKIWLYDDKLVISGWFSEDKTEIPFDMVDEVTKNGAAGGFVCRVDCSTMVTHNPYYGNREGAVK